MSESLDERVYGHAQAMHELVDLRVELDKARKEIARLTSDLIRAEGELAKLEKDRAR